MLCWESSKSTIKRPTSRFALKSLLWNVWDMWQEVPFGNHLRKYYVQLTIIYNYLASISNKKMVHLLICVLLLTIFIDLWPAVLVLVQCWTSFQFIFPHFKSALYFRRWENNIQNIFMPRLAKFSRLFAISSFVMEDVPLLFLRGGK